MHTMIRIDGARDGALHRSNDALDRAIFLLRALKQYEALPNTKRSKRWSIAIDHLAEGPCGAQRSRSEVLNDALDKALRDH